MTGQVAVSMLLLLTTRLGGAAGEPEHQAAHNCTEISHFVPDHKAVDTNFRSYYFPPSNTSQQYQVGCLVLMFTVWVLTWIWLPLAETYLEDDMFGRTREGNTPNERKTTWDRTEGLGIAIENASCRGELVPDGFLNKVLAAAHR